MADVKETVSVLVEDLNKKIKDLNGISGNVDSETLAKIEDIKQKATTVLKQVSNKIVDTVEYVNDSEEVQKSIEIVRIKSQELYNNAINRINDLVGQNTIEEIKNDVSEVLNSAKNDIDEFFKREDVSNITNEVKEKVDDMSEKVVNTLKGWLKAEEK